MSLTQVPAHSSLADQQYISVQGPDTIVSGFTYDRQTRTLYANKYQAFTSTAHGSTHIAEDPVPSATCDSAGLMSADDKAKLDALLQMRIGVLGFQGAGFSDDGGWMDGDVILAAGTDFISLERVGNVIMFNVDAPIQLNCGQEACAQIFWIQDESDVSAIRPPSCAGKLPGVNGYGELKIYLMPESLIVNSANPASSLTTRGRYPSLIFKRYDDAIVPGSAEFEMTLKRNSTNLVEMEVGWAFTPNPTLAECVWFMGKDDDGNRISFELMPESDVNILGSMLYMGHLLTKRMGVITGYTSHALSTNQYYFKWWDIIGATAVGDELTATNIWKYTNAEASNKELTLDRTYGIIDVGTLVDIWFFKTGEVGGQDLRRYFFSKRPDPSYDDIWACTGAVEFGNSLIARYESEEPGTGTEKFAGEDVDDVRVMERSLWGISGFDHPIMLYDESGTAGISDDLGNHYIAEISNTLPGLVVSSNEGTDPYCQRPVSLWNRSVTPGCLATIHLGRPDPVKQLTPTIISPYPPYDILLNANIDSHDNIYLKVIGKGAFNTSGYYTLLKGAHFRDLPKSGAIRLLTGTTNAVWRFNNKLLYPGFDDDAIALASDDEFPGEIGDIAELLHQEYGGLCVRIEFTQDGDEIQAQFKVGTLDMATGYESDITDDVDDYVRGLAAGYTVSSIYTQSASYSGVGTVPTVNYDGWLVYDGGLPTGTDAGTTEYWNELEIMYRSGQVWIWWNNWLIPPNAELNSALDTPVVTNTPYFPVTDPTNEYGKFGMRLWPGARIRRILLRAPTRNYSVYSRGQLELS